MFLISYKKLNKAISQLLQLNELSHCSLLIHPGHLLPEKPRSKRSICTRHTLNISHYTLCFPSLIVQPEKWACSTLVWWAVDSNGPILWLAPSVLTWNASSIYIVGTHTVKIANQQPSHLFRGGCLSENEVPLGATQRSRWNLFYLHYVKQITSSASGRKTRRPRKPRKSLKSLVNLLLSSPASVQVTLGKIESGHWGKQDTQSLKSDIILESWFCLSVRTLCHTLRHSDKTKTWQKCEITETYGFRGTGFPNIQRQTHTVVLLPSRPLSPMLFLRFCLWRWGSPAISSPQHLQVGRTSQEHKYSS